MSAENNVPEIRFKRFSGEWEGKVLGEHVADIIGGGTPPTQISEYWNGDIDWYSPTEIGKKVYADNSEKKITQEGLKKSSARILPANKTVLFTSRAGIGDMAILSNDGCTNQGFQSLVLKSDHDTYFLYSIGHQIKDYALKHASGSTFLEISGKQLSKMAIKMPCTKEQTKIGNYFQQLDTLITQHQQKHNKLLNLKKALLEKMFPKQDETMPEIRFKGFSGEWEEKELGEYAQFRRGSFPQPYGNKEWYGGEGAMPFVQVVDVTDKLTLVKDTKQKISVIAQPKSVLVEKGKVLVTLQGSIGRVAIAQYNTYVDRTLLIFEGFKKKTNSHYWAYIIQNKFDIEKKRAPGGTIKTITKEALSAFRVNIPEHEEQTKIGTIFKQLDTLITQHQAQLKKLNNIKQACLEKMFV